MHTGHGFSAALFCGVLAGMVAADPAELAVSDLHMIPDSTADLIIWGSIAGQSTFGVTVQVEIVARGGARGAIRFTPAPPVDIEQIGDPWPGVGTFSAFDTDLTSSDTLNGSVDDNGTFVAEPTTFTGQLTAFPIVASADARGVWDVTLSTSQGDSSWEGIPTVLIPGTITVSSDPAAPAVSSWGLIVMTLLALAAGTIMFRQVRRGVVPADSSW